ncbi:transcriptional regulator, TetR family [Frankineae bacterium MT45]|nr:transcriptional regulator, TetR family [Frankineae bacterium MT45]
MSYPAVETPAPAGSECPRSESLRSDGLRSDAKSNRERILAAAAQAFAEEGLSISLVEIARRAGVGNATLHRNFTKEQLVQELFEDWFARRQAVAAQALADPDAWHGLVSFLEDVLVVGTRNRAIRPLFAIRPQWRERFRALIGELLQRAQQSGQARPDLTAEDVFLVMLGILRTMGITAETAPEQWRRHLAVVLDGMKSRNADRLPGLSVSAQQLDSELGEWSDRVLRTGLC